MGNAKTKQGDISSIKTELRKKQKGKCPICGKSILGISLTKLACDHDHKTGVIRGCLHMGCNGLEGKVFNLVMRWGKAGNNIKKVVETLENLINYWKLHQEPQTNLIYYTHKTPSEKRKANNAKKRRAYRRKNGR